MIQLTNINKTYNNGAPLHVLKGINLNMNRGNLFLSWSIRVWEINFTQHIGNPRQLRYRRLLLEQRTYQNLSETKAAEYRNRMIGFIFQSFNLISFKDAVENVALPLFYQGISRKKRNALALEYSTVWV